MNKAGFHRLLGAAFAVFVGFLPVHAQESSPTIGEALEFEPPTWNIGSAELTLGGFAGGAVFTQYQRGGPLRGSYDTTDGSAVVTANAGIRRILDNGMILGARGDVLLFHDALSGDNYDSDTIQRLYVFAQTGFGRIELGQQDGAAYSLALVGPIVDEQVTLEARNISLFRNPITRDEFGSFFQSTTSVQSTSNYAKVNYISPRLFGVQLGASFTPDTVRAPLPGTGNAPDLANRQHNIFELAVNYTSYISDVAVGVSAGYAHGAVEHKTPGGRDLEDFALGAQLAYMISDVRLSVGGAYRITNAYLLNIDDAGRGRRTDALHLSAMAERGAFLFGVEYSDADIKGPVDFDVKGYQVSAGYKINNNMQLTGGWQWYDYRRDLGLFHNGLSKIDMNAGFLSLGYQL